MRKKKKFEKAKEFVTRMKKVHEEAETALRKNQEEIRRYIDRKRSKAEEYQVRDWISFKYKRFDIPNIRKENGRTDREICWTL